MNAEIRPAWREPDKSPTPWAGLVALWMHGAIGATRRAATWAYMVFAGVAVARLLGYLDDNRAESILEAFKNEDVDGFFAV